MKEGAIVILRRKEQRVGNCASNRRHSDFGQAYDGMNDVEKECI
jgi:hypothetical protein